MASKIKVLMTSLCGVVFLAAAGAAGPLDELDALANAAPGEYGKVFDKNLASANAGYAAPVTQQRLKQLMLQDLDSLRNIMAARYAPAPWKAEQFGWDLDAEIQKAKDQVNASASFGVRDYQKLLKSLLNSTRDYHVSVSFHSTEFASLPFGVTEAGGRYFISGINRKALPENVFPYKVGDEITAFDGKPVAEVTAELKRKAGVNNVPHTDEAMAAMMALTSRGAMQGDAVPQGPVAVSIKPAGAAEAVPFQMAWRYSPEFIAPQPFLAKRAGLKLPMSWLGMMALETPYGGGAQASYGLGNKDGFLPDFGEKVWEAPADNSFRAYVYRSPASGANIGFVRIPTYMVSDPGKLVKDSPRWCRSSTAWPTRLLSTRPITPAA